MAQIITQAIETKYLNPTNSKGSRIKAQTHARTRIYHWDSSLDVEENHIAAATMLHQELIKECHWPRTKFITGSIKSGSYVHVFKVVV